MKLALPFASPILIARASSAMAQSSESAKKEGMDLATRWEAPVNIERAPTPQRKPSPIFSPAMPCSISPRRPLSARLGLRNSIVRSSRRTTPPRSRRCARGWKLGLGLRHHYRKTLWQASQHFLGRGVRELETTARIIHPTSVPLAGLARLPRRATLSTDPNRCPSSDGPVLS
jgi:hypothetical protein